MLAPCMLAARSQCYWDKALLQLETRGATSQINEYMAGEAARIIEAAAAMYDVKVKITEMGGAAGGQQYAGIV